MRKLINVLNENVEPESNDKLFANIAKKYLHIDTLKNQNSDELDFHDVAVWSIKNALQAAYDAGKKSMESTEKKI
jgi:hypothetical protein